MYSNIEQTGIHKIASIVVKEFNWIFREQPIDDFGIDAQIEIVENNYPTGKLIALQIKSGKSYLKQSNNDGFYYYGDNKHLDYWLNHSLPVIIVFYNPINDKCYWQHITNGNIQKTKLSWKTFIDFSNQLDIKSKKYIHNLLLKESEETKKFKQLIFNYGLMKFLMEGNSISIYIEDYINKSYKRGIIKIILIDKCENETIEKEWFGFHGLLGIEDILGYSFPWADYNIDYDFYEINFDREDVESVMGFVDFDDIYPYEIISNEIACYRLSLQLNSLGKSFYEIMYYLYS